MNYTLTKIKTFTGHEGHGLNAVICRNGKPICFVLDDANGGEVEYDFRNPEQNPRSFQRTTAEDAKREEIDMGDYLLSQLDDAARQELDEHQKSVQSYSPNLNVDMWRRHTAIEHWVNVQVDNHINKKRFDRMAKKKTLFRLQGDEEDVWRTLKLPYSDPRAKQFLDQKYAGKVVAIYGVQ